jgi:hypothetical protein
VHTSESRSTLPFHSSHSSNSISSSSSKQEVPQQQQQRYKESFNQRLNAAAADGAVPMDVDATLEPQPEQAQQQQQLQQAPRQVRSAHSYDPTQHVAGSAAAAVSAAPASSGPAAAAAAAVPGACASVWGDIPVEVMAQVARFMGSTVAAVMPICMTCR